MLKKKLWFTLLVYGLEATHEVAKMNHQLLKNKSFRKNCLVLTCLIPPLSRNEKDARGTTKQTIKDVVTKISGFSKVD
jgi:hypothetical protein